MGKVERDRRPSDGRKHTTDAKKTYNQERNQYQNIPYNREWYQ